MRRKLITLALSGALLCALGAPAAGVAGETSALPESLLYYGQVKEVLTEADGTISGLYMASPRSGEFVMKMSGETVWIDSGNRTASDPSDVAAGEYLYVFHSPVSTRSLPPQSAAFAVVRNVQEDVGCAQYHRVEAVEESEGALRITTSNGGLLLYTSEKTTLSAYREDRAVGPEELRAGSHVMAWYGDVALSYPGQTWAQHIMVLDRGEEEPLTRAGFAVLLHTTQGSPVVNYAMEFSDVDPAASYGEAIRWASSGGLISGYGDGKAGPDDVLTREQMVVILWRWAGSPILMDYPGLSSFSDAGEISLYAQQALVWAHQQGLIPAEGRLGPRDTVTRAEAEAMIKAVKARS